VTAGGQRGQTRTASSLVRRALPGVLALIVFLGGWAFLGHWFYGRHASARTQNHDVVVYRGYARAIRAGQLPYRDFSLVYPPGGLPAFIAPSYVSDGTLAAYRTWFARLVAACGALCLLLVLAARPPRLAVAFVALSPLLVGSILLSRYDLWPAALATGALAAFLRDRHPLGFAALAAAVAAKLFALVLVPVAVVWTLRRAGARALARALASFAIVVAASFGPFAVLAPHGLWLSLRDQASRAIQIESFLGAGIMTFAHPQVIVSLGSVSVAGYHRTALAWSALEAIVLLALWAGFACGTSEADRLVRYGAACVCAFIVLGKVLSPQYLIWLVPLVPLVRGRRGQLATGLLAVALIATQWYFPAHYDALVHFHLAWFVLTRDAVLVVLLAVLALPTLETLRTGLGPRS
jgi:glycosyl transferase family 87